MIKNLTGGKCSNGTFDLTANTVQSINIPDDAIGIKILPDADIVVNIDSAPETQTANTLKKGALIVADILENRIISLGNSRKLYLLSTADCSVKIEFWG